MHQELKINMTGNDKFFSENEKKMLMNSIINTDYNDENETWDLSLELEHISIVLRRNILEKNND